MYIVSRGNNVNLLDERKVREYENKHQEYRNVSKAESQNHESTVSMQKEHYFDHPKNVFAKFIHLRLVIGGKKNNTENSITYLFGITLNKRIFNESESREKSLRHNLK